MNKLIVLLAILVTSIALADGGHGSAGNGTHPQGQKSGSTNKIESFKGGAGNKGAMDGAGGGGPFPFSGGAGNKSEVSKSITGGENGRT